MSDDSWAPCPQGAPTNEHVAELLGITVDEVSTYRLGTTKEGNLWRVYLAVEIRSPLRVSRPTENIPDNLILEVPAVD